MPGAAAREIRAEFLAPIAEALPIRWPGGPDVAWVLLRNGSWGLCLKDIAPENAITKERARIAVAAHRETEPEDPAVLKVEIENYDAVTLPFSPHELPESSRQREIGPARQRRAT